jgi:hypothetical protein
MTTETEKTEPKACDHTTTRVTAAGTVNARCTRDVYWHIHVRGITQATTYLCDIHGKQSMAQLKRGSLQWSATPILPPEEEETECTKR